MAYKNILFIVIASSLFSCNWGVPHNKKPDITKDTLLYTYKTIKQRASDCGNKPDSSCTVAKITYPVFTGQKTLSDSIIHKFNNLFGDDKKPDTSLNQIANLFVESYDDFRKEDPKSALFFTLEAHAKVLRQDSGITTIEVAGHSYTGGAHGASYTYYVNWNTKDNKSIGLNDILVEGYKNKLTKIAEGIFRKNEKLDSTSSLASQNNYFFPKGEYSLPDNYLITPIGLKFLYNLYTIKPYAAGPTELLIPYTQIKSLVRPNTVVTQYLK